MTDIFVNRSKEVWAETLDGKLEMHAAPELDDATLWRLSRQIASLSDQGISREHPLLSAILPGGERVQIVAPPATRGSIAMAVRKHSLANFGLADYERNGAFSGLATEKNNDRTKLDAELSFPARIKQSLGNWRVGAPTTIDDRDVQVVQGSSGGTLATLYFDAASGLLVRLVRYADSRVGRLPTQFDYADYRDVAGVKMPFKWKMTWLDGFEDVTLTDIQPNVAIDAGKFAKPAR